MSDDDIYEKHRRAARFQSAAASSNPVKSALGRLGLNLVRVADCLRQLRLRLEDHARGMERNE